MLNRLLDLLFPRRSLTGEEGALITLNERKALRVLPVIEDTVALRRRGIIDLDRITAAMPYHASPLVQKAVHTFKYNRVPGLAADLARLIVEAVGTRPHTTAVLCPVPLHWSRRYSRGFNQAERLSLAIARELEMPVRGLLKRKRATGHQAHRRRAERLTAVRGAFECIASQVPRHVILIDDLATTGATLDACAHALKTAGAEYVEAWVVAHG